MGDISDEEAGGILICLTEDPCKEKLSEAMKSSSGGIGKNCTVLDELHRQSMGYPAISENNQSKQLRRALGKSYNKKM